MNRIVVIGAGGFGRECAEIIRFMSLDSIKNAVIYNQNLPVKGDIECIGFLDDNEELHGKKFNGIKVLGGLNWILTNNDFFPIYFVCGIGVPKIKEKVVKRALKLGYKPITIIHPSVLIFTGAKIGVGCVIAAKSIISINTKIGDYTLINHTCSIGHDAITGKYCFVSPLVAMSGFSEIGCGVSLGTCSSIIPYRKVGDWSTIGAGACVIRDIPSNVTAVGVPAKVIWRKRE